MDRNPVRRHCLDWSAGTSTGRKDFSTKGRRRSRFSYGSLQASGPPDPIQGTILVTIHRLRSQTYDPRNADRIPSTPAPFVPDRCDGEVRPLVTNIGENANAVADAFTSATTH